MTCPLAKFDPRGLACSYRADGQPDRCHWIPKQRLTAEYRRRGYEEAVIELAIMDSRIITDGCRRHHDQLDGRNAINRLALRAVDYPAEVYEYAWEFCWWWVDKRTGFRPDRRRLDKGAPLPGLLVDFEPVE